MRIAVLISGGGTTLRNLIDKSQKGELPVEIACVVSSSPDARGLEYARAADIPTFVAPWRKDQSPEAFSSAVFGPCRAAGVNGVAMGGFLKHVLIPNDFENRVINIHPALIPAFCGPGMYGRHVHQAVLAYGAKISGCTVHFVDHQYDHGPIILQQAVPVLDDDTAETLAVRVFAAECEAYPEAIRLWSAGRLHLEGRRVRVDAGSGVGGQGSGRRTS